MTLFHHLPHSSNRKKGVDKTLTIDDLSAKLEAWSIEKLAVELKRHNLTGTPVMVAEPATGGSNDNPKCHWCWSTDGHLEYQCRAKRSYLESHPRVRQALAQERREQHIGGGRGRGHDGGRGGRTVPTFVTQVSNTPKYEEYDDDAAWAMGLMSRPSF